LFLVVALFLPETRVWGFEITPQPASGVFASVTPSSTGENYDGCQYDASDSLLAAKGIQAFRHYGYAEDAAKFQGGLRPGSYATHNRGRPMHGPTAQNRLALPNEAPPNAYYKVRVGPETPVGGPRPVSPTAIPPRAGGGIEYTFPRGTSPGSVEGPFLIP